MKNSYIACTAMLLGLTTQPVSSAEFVLTNSALKCQDVGDWEMTSRSLSFNPDLPFSIEKNVCTVENNLVLMFSS